MMQDARRTKTQLSLFLGEFEIELNISLVKLRLGASCVLTG